MFFRSRKKVSFMTEKQTAKNRTKKFAIYFACIAVLVLGLSLLIVLEKNDFSLRAVLGGDTVTQQAGENKADKAVSTSCDNTFFIWVASKDRSKMRFLWLVRAQMPEGRISVCTVAPDSILTLDGKSVTFEQVYSESGEKALVGAMEAYTGFRFDRYIGATEENFKAFINYLGGVEIDVPEQIEYKGGEFNAILVKGRQNMKGDTLFRYFMYLGDSESEGVRAQSKALGEVFTYMFSKKYIQRRSNIFSKITNSMITNMTIVDFSTEDENISRLMENGIKKIDIISVPSELVK